MATTVDVAYPAPRHHGTATAMRSLVGALCVIAFLLAVGSSINSPEDSLVVVFPALGILFVTALPILVTRSVDAFSPWAHLFYFVLLNVLARSLYIANDLPSASAIRDIFLLGHDKEFLAFPGVVMLAGFSFVAMGYLAEARRRPDRSGRFDATHDIWHSRRFTWTIVLLLVLSWIGVYRFVMVSLGDLAALLANLSSYRGVSNELVEYRAHGWLRALANLSDVVFYLTLTAILSTRRSSLFVKAACAAALATSAVFYTFTQSRGALLGLFVNAIALRYYCGDRRIPAKLVAIAVPVMLALFVTLTGLRQGSGYTLASFAALSPARIVEPLVVNNGGIDVSKTGHIIEHVSPDLDLSFGATYGWLGVAWIPRQLWPTKPVNIDTRIGMEIYGAESFGAGGVPPGFMGELFINFWYFGIPIGCWLLGRILGLIHARFITRDVGRNAVLIYVVFFMSTGLAVLGSSVVSYLAGILPPLVAIVCVLRYITVRESTPERAR